MGYSGLLGKHEGKKPLEEQSQMGEECENGTDMSYECS